MHIITIARLIRLIRRRKAASAGLALGFLAVAIIGNAITFRIFDAHLYKDGLSIGDALWYSVISVSTIGYGDFYAQSTGARIGLILFIFVIGMGSFTVLLGMSVDWITDLALREQRGMSTAMASDHILIVNFPSEARVRQLIEELQADPDHKTRDIVLINDTLDELPFRRDYVTFVKGPVLDETTYRRANVEDARMAIVLATSYADPNSDAVVASASAVIDRIHAEVHLVVECLNPAHRLLFSSVNANAIVYSMSISGNLLAQEAQDPGVSQMVDVFTSNIRGATLFSTVVGSSDSKTYRELAVKLLERDINLICVNRGEESLTSFTDLQPREGDRAIYAASRRLDWSELTGSA